MAESACVSASAADANSRNEGDGKMITITILAVTFIAGVIAGIIALLCASISREESGRSIQDKPPTRAAKATRRIVGWHGTTPKLVIGPGNVARWADGSVSR
jgi:hypothetical protein